MNHVSGPVAFDRSSSVAELSCYDRSAALEIFGGDEGLMADVAGAFVADAPRQLGAIVAALVDADAVRARRHAHSLLGAAGRFGTCRVTAWTGLVERAAAVGDLDEAERLLPSLSREVEALLTALRLDLSGTCDSTD